MHLRIKKIRQEAGLSMEVFGSRIGIGKSAVSKIERGDNGASPQTQRLICQEFGVNPSWLLTGEGEMYVQADNSVEGLAAELVVSLRGNDFAIALFREAARLFTADDWRRLRECLETALESIKKSEQP